MQESRIIGKRVMYGIPSTLVVLLFILFIGGLGLSIAGILIDDSTGKAIMLIVGIGAFVGGGLGIFFIFRSKKLRVKAADKPTVVLEDNDTLRLFLLNGSEAQVKVNNIKKVFYIPRHTSRFGFMKVVHEFHNDGKLFLKLLDGKTIKVACVDNIKEVREEILKLQMTA